MKLKFCHSAEIICAFPIIHQMDKLIIFIYHNYSFLTSNYVGIYFSYTEIAEEFPFNSKRRTMERMKKKGPEPATISQGIREFFEVISEEEWSEHLTYTGGKVQLSLITDCDGCDSVLIWDPGFFKLFEDADMFSIDATFSRVPLINDKKAMRNHQLITVIAVKDNVVFALLSFAFFPIQM